MAQSEPGPTRNWGSPGLWLGCMLAAIGIIAGLAITDAIGKYTAMLLLLIPAGLMFPLAKSSKQKNAACGGNSTAQKRYTRRVAIFTSAYLASFALMTFLQEFGEVAYALRVVLALLPGLAILGVLWAVGRLIVEETDEFLRMLTVRQSLIATGLALSAASIWGFLQAGDIAPPVDLYWVTIIWFLGLGVGAIVNRVQFGTWGAV